MVKHKRAGADELFECVWLFCGSGYIIEGIKAVLFYFLNEKRLGSISR